MVGDLPPGSILARGFDWDTVAFAPRRVGEFAELRYGKSLVASTRKTGLVPVYGTNGQCGWHDKSLFEGPGVILGRKGQGPLGVEWCDVPFWVIDTAYYADVDLVDVDLKWFYYVTNYVGLNHLKSGEKPGLQREVFRAQIFPFPPRKTQTAIAAMLGALDDKIELNLQTSHTLEALASNLFAKWLSDHDSHLRTVKARQLIDSSVLMVGDGYRAKNSELAHEGRPFARAGNLNNGFQFGDADLLGMDGVRTAGEKNSRVYDSVFTSKGTVGRIALVLPNTPQFVYSPQLCFWRTLDFVHLHPLILYRWMLGNEFREQVDAVKGQTDMADYVNLKDQREMEITLPWAVDQLMLVGMIEPLVDGIDEAEIESRSLAKLRDAILPHLLSGEMRIKDAEKIVGKAL